MFFFAQCLSEDSKINCIGLVEHSSYDHGWLTGLKVPQLPSFSAAVDTLNKSDKNLETKQPYKFL
jgi:hypothetical protein